MRDVPELKAIQALVLNLGKTIWCVGIGLLSWPTMKWTRYPTLAEDRIIFITKAPHGLVS